MFTFSINIADPNDLCYEQEGKVQEDYKGKWKNPAIPKALGFSDPMIPSYVFYFMSTCASFVIRTKIEVFVPQEATGCLSRDRGMSLFILCIRMTVSGPESGN